MKHIYRCRVCGRFTEENIHCGVQTVLFLESSRRLRLSKLLSGLLRHYPWEIGIKIDRSGWVNIDELVKGIRTRWRNKELYQWVTRDHIIAVAVLDPKGRFEVKNNFIRARYGHSIKVDINYEIHYPRILYHGTSIDRVKSILEKGLKPMKRLYVHATTSIETALETGRRHGKPIILRIDIDCLKRQGIPVYKASRSTYLIPYVPKECIVYG